MNIDPESTQRALEAAKPFLEKIVNPPLDEIGLLVQDRVRLWRFNQQLKIVTRAKELAEKHNIKLKEVPLKILAPLLEGASLEEDLDLQEMWANLLVNYADNEQQLTSSIFPNMLSQLSTREVRVLKFNLENYKTQFLNRSNWEAGEKLSSYEISNLLRLGILDEESTYIDNTETPNSIRNDNRIKMNEHSGLTKKVDLTELGWLFLKACTEPKKE